MNELRSILVHLDASPRSVRRLQLARELAAALDARVATVYATTPSVLSVPYLMAEGAAEMLPLLQQLDRDYRDDARGRFDRVVADAPDAIVWHELRSGPVTAGVARLALCHDLLVLGQHDAADPLTIGVPADFVESVLLASGQAALVVPHVDSVGTCGRRALIAWKPTREAARAVAAAVPLLRRAQRIDLAVADEPGGGDDVEALIGLLRLHGVQAAVERHAVLASADAGEQLLSLAADRGADLLVRGGYGHTRAREFVLGGASRTVLRSMTLPVLMAH